MQFSSTEFNFNIFFFQYCHYVAGLVGIGLSRLFSASQLEDAIVGKDTDLANSMGVVPPENQHHQGLLGRQSRRQGILAQRCKNCCAVLLTKGSNC